jgi:hypothetical protein
MEVMIWNFLAWMPIVIAAAIILRRFWRCGILGFWMPARVRDRHLRGHELARDAEHQHAAFLSGHPKGFFGNYPPADLS